MYVASYLVENYEQNERVSLTELAVYNMSFNCKVHVFNGTTLILLQELSSVIVSSVSDHLLR